MTADLIIKIDEINSLVRENFGKLSQNQLSWKPGPGQWCIAECLKHIITSNESYFPALRKMSGHYKQSFWEKYNPLSKSTGRNMVKTLGIHVVKRFKAPVIFQPGKIATGNNIIGDFEQHQEELKKIVAAFGTKEIQKMIITSPVSPLITLPLSDCLKVITGHEERHFNQALKVLKAENFPAT